MNRFFGCIVRALVLCVVHQASTGEITVSVSKEKGLSAMTCNDERTALLLVINGDHEHLWPLVRQVRADLEHTGLFSVRIEQDSMPVVMQDIKKKFHEGLPFVLYITMQQGELCAHGRLYNTLDVIMLEGKRWTQRSTVREWAHHIAHDVWRAVMGSESSFLSSIVYVKRAEKRAGGVVSALVVTDWDGAGAKTVLTRSTQVLAPAWLCNTLGEEWKYLLFSEFTPINVRLMKTNCQGSIEVVFDGSGTTVGVSALGAEQPLVYCRSGVLWRYSYNSESNSGTHEPIVSEEHAAACPVLLKNGDVIYCSQGKIKRWSASDGSSKGSGVVIIDKGFSTAPTVHEEHNALVYVARVKGVMQLIASDMTGGGRKQLTSGPGDKVDPAFSPCGNFIVFTRTLGKKSSICVINLPSSLIEEISPAKEYCFCPSWSL